MRDFELRIYFVGMILLLGLAFQTWSSPSAVQADSEVLIFDPGSAGVVSVNWTGQRSAAYLEFSGPVDEAEVWVTAGRRRRVEGPKPPSESTEQPPQTAADDSGALDEPTEGDSPPSSGESAEPEEPVYGPPELTSFPGNSSAAALAQRFSPLRALRRFDELDEVRLEEMGLTAATSRLEVTGASGKTVLEIGNKAYGSSDVYAREPGSSSAFLVSRKVVGSLKSASTTLRDKDLLGFEPTDAVAAQIAASKSKAPLQARHQGRHDKANAFWSTESSTELATGLDALLGAVLKLRAKRYLQEDEAPDVSSLTPLVSVRFQGERDLLSELDVASQPPESSEDDAKPSWFARSTRTRGQWAEISSGEATELEELLRALGGE